MLIDLNELRPQNETFEHFLLKQTGRAFLLKQGIRCVGTEVSLFEGGYDRPPFGEHKRVIDVIGIDRREKKNPYAEKLFNRIEKKALKHGERLGITRTYNSGIGWNSPPYGDSDKYAEFEETKNHCFELASEEMGYDKFLYKRLECAWGYIYQTRGIEAKASYSDFRNGFSMAADYTYIIAPLGVVPVNELPKEVGLLEFDFDMYEKGELWGDSRWEKCLKITKQTKKRYDSCFYEDRIKRKGFMFDKHKNFCEELLFRISQQNTHESVYWNPHLIALEENKYYNPKWDHSFQYKIGDKNEYGIVCDRRWGLNPDKSKRQSSDREINYYRMVQEGVGMTKWIPVTEIKEWSIARGEPKIITKKNTRIIKR